MELRTGYKQTEGGMIPEDWEVSEINELATMKSGVGITSGSIDEHSDFPCYGGNGIRGYTKQFTHSGSYALIGRQGALCGNVVLARGQFFASEHAVVVTPRSRTDIEWLSVVLSEMNLGQYSESSAQPGLSVGKLQKLPIAHPKSPDEQRAIAAALCDADALIASLDALIAKKRDLKQAAMQQLLTGRKRMPGFTGEWEVRRLGDVGRCLRGVTYKGDSDLSTHDTTETKRLLRSNNVQDAIVTTSDLQFVSALRVSATQILKFDDILVCMANGSRALVGKSGRVINDDGFQYTFGAFMGCFRTNASAANPGFVFALFQTSLYRNYINNLLAGSSINNLAPRSIESLDFSFPSETEQTAIAEVLSDMDAELAELEVQRDKGRALKQGMMQELLTGRIRLA